MKQVLSADQRRKIRKGINRGRKKPRDYVNIKDKKNRLFQKYCEGKEVLDLGSVEHDPVNMESEFWLFKALDRVAKRIVGLDYYEPGVIEMTKAGYQVVTADAQDFNLNEKFDVISVGDLIEHLPNPGEMLQCARLHLRDEGHIIIATPNAFCWKYILYHSVFGNSEKINREHVAWFCRTTLTWLADRYKLKPVEYAYVSRRWWERIIPLPKHIKHTTLVVVFSGS